MKKNTKILIGVSAAIVLLIAGIIVLLKSGTSEPSEPAATKAPVQQYDAYKIARADVKDFVINLESESIKFVNTGNDTWSVNGTPYEETDGTKLESLLMCVFTMMSNHEIEKGASDLSKYGLDKPSVTIDINRADGGSDRLLIGDVSPTLGENFFTVEGSGDVYTIYAYKVDTITKPSSYYKTYDRFNVKVDDITGIKLERRGMDTLELRMKNIGQNDGYSVVWEVVKPYEQVFNGIDQFINDKILTPIDELAISAPADAGKDYGFENPSAKVTLTVEPYNEQDGTRGAAQTEQLIIGNTSEGVTYVQYDGKAYAVAKDDVGFAYTDAFLAVSKLQALVDIQNTDKVTVKAPSGTTVIDIAHGSEPSDVTFKVNGTDADTKLSKQIYQSIIAMNVDSVYNGEQTGDAEITIDYNGYKGAENVKIELKPINELYYALTRNGKTYFVIKKTTVDEMLEKLNEYAQNSMGTK